MKTLPETLAYRNSELLLRIQRALHTNIGEASRIFADVKGWLWLCARHRQVRQRKIQQSDGIRLTYLAMLEHFSAIDMGWHEFILMTHDYQHFCEEYLDGFIHHVPAHINAATLQRKKRFQTKRYLTRYLSFIEDELGTRRLQRWLTGLPPVSASPQETP